MLGLVGGALVGWQGHVIVCGLADVGLRIVEQLALSGVPAVVVDDDPAPALARMLAAWGVPLVTGPARAEETLMSAGLAEAVAVICAQDDDLSALETALLARRLRAGGGRRPVLRSQLSPWRCGRRSRRSARCRRPS
jgi:voltage-gated potassium channel Kch